MRITSLASLALVALLAGTASADRIQAESTYFSGGSVLSEHDGVEFVRSDGMTTFAFETQFPASDAELVICTRAGGDAAVVDVEIDPLGAAGAILRHTEVIGWTTTSIRVSNVPTTPVIVTVNISSSKEVDVDYFEACRQEGNEGPCDGCSLGPWAGTWFEQGEKQKIQIPALGKLGEVPGVNIYTALLGMIDITATNITAAFADQPIDGGCYMQRPAGAQECADKECLPSKGCSLRSFVQFTPNNYPRFPWVDTREEVVYPDGSKRSFIRDSGPRNIFKTITAACNTADHIVWKFKHRARVIQTITCLPCAGSSSNY